MIDFAELCNGGLTRIKPYQAGRPIEEVKRELGLEDVIKLASNENPFGMSPKALKAAQKVLTEGNFYPDSNGYYLKQKLKNKWGYDPLCVTLGAGSNELINLLFQAFVNDKVNVVLPEYSFVVYSMEATVNAAQVKTVPLKNYCADIDGLIAAVDERTRVVALANPSNPIGTGVSGAELERLLNALPESTLLVIDEAYNEFNEGQGDYVDSARLMGTHPNLVISRTFSKAYGLAGLRVGYMLTNPDIASLLNRLRAPFNVNAPALAAAEAAIDDQTFIRKVVENNTRERERFYAFCKETGLTAIPSQANFVAIDFAPLKLDAQQINQELLKQGVIVRPLTGYQLPTLLRVSIGTPEQNERFFSVLRGLLKEYY
ncbi:MAG: histidinol-phosphate transaminase [Succinivibrio sp.]|nr:histidinol-phosphate transaminase [Succinivibrio sp.]